ncbi:hypothetical protein RsoM2USA_29 [Ralstonia phage RsoM2USA]|nr:hypothetical protein RsoM2USA_29 [Ralstonia phage RsoM2USA]
MTTFIDRRGASKGKSSENRKKFLRRVNNSIKEALPDIIKGKGIKEVGSSGADVYIKRKTIDEPTFQHDFERGNKEFVRPGNKDFNTGDSLPKPKGGGQGGRGAGEPGEGDDEVDDIVIRLSRDEFLQYFFEGLELPDLVKESIAKIKETKYHTAGWTNTGSPAKLSVTKSLKQSFSRRAAFKSSIKAKIKELQKEYDQLVFINTKASVDRRNEIIEQIDKLKAKLENMAFIDPIDLRYRATVVEEIESKHAAMICIMDNSGSMGETEKLIARKFYMLLYLFLVRDYDNIDLAFVHHTTTAKEVNEDEFFDSGMTGGTLVLPALELADEIIRKRFSDTNVYVCQASDGDSFGDDASRCREFLNNTLLPKVQYYAYVEIASSSGWRGGGKSELMAQYEGLAATNKRLNVAYIKDETEIYSVFRNLFEVKK